MDAYILLVSVPWWATMTVFRVGSYPTYPKRWFSKPAEEACQGNSQYCVRLPSPPVDTGMKDGFALQFVPQVQVKVELGSQYPAAE